MVNGKLQIVNSELSVQNPEFLAQVWAIIYFTDRLYFDTV